MGLLDLLRGVKKTLTTEDIHNSLDGSDIASHNNKEIIIENKKYSIPIDVARLLWFLDGPFKNFTPDNKKEVVKINGFILEIFLDRHEPSAISLKLAVIIPKNKEEIENPGYFPSYETLSPKQRWVYLDWLRDIKKEINIGYVFIFYYGLERHLFFGDAEAAFNMILNLRQFHKNKSFLYYSSNALIAACIFHKRADWFLKFINTVSDVDEIYVNDLYILAKYALKLNLTAKELMKISKNVGFNNQRYIKDEPELFEQELRKILLDSYKIDEMPLDKFNLNDCPMETQLILANYSFEANQRQINIPSLIHNKIFTQTVRLMLEVTHENVKRILQQLRNSSDNTYLFKEVNNKAKKQPDEVYKKSLIFDAIDVHMFDENIRYYNEGICSNCKNKISKRPVRKGKCSICKNYIIVAESEFTGEKAMFTEDEYKKMADIRKERAYRNWVYKILKSENIELKKFAKIVKEESNDINNALIKAVSEKAELHYKNFDLGLYRNCLLQIGEIYERIEKLQEALDMYFLVCYYDLLGCVNGPEKFNEESVFLAPAVISWITNIAQKLNLNNEELKKRYKNAVNKAKDKSTIKKIEDTWEKIEEAINSR